MNIGKYVKRYSDDLRFKNYSERTIENYACQVRMFLEYFNKTATKPSEITEQQIKAWLMLAKTLNSRKQRRLFIKNDYPNIKN